MNCCHPTLTVLPSLSLSLSVAPELVLRKVINFSDCTVCLDKRNASGKIEFYQDPLLYKCSFRTRLHFTYDNINAKIPAVIKVRERVCCVSGWRLRSLVRHCSFCMCVEVHTMVESLKLSLTDQQLPMFIRLMELGVALYYGEMGVHRDGEREESGSLRESVPGEFFCLSSPECGFASLILLFSCLLL